MKNRQAEDHFAASTSGSAAQIGGDQKVISMPDRTVSKKTPKTSITPNTVAVICAIAALIAILVFLESRIGRLSVHAAPRSAPRFSAVPRQIFDNFVN